MDYQSKVKIEAITPNGGYHYFSDITIFNRSIKIRKASRAQNDVCGQTSNAKRRSGNRVYNDKRQSFSQGNREPRVEFSTRHAFAMV